MKRKVIQIAESTQLISLPRKWSLAHNIKKGDELEVDEDGSRIIVSTKKGIEFQKAEINLDGLDRTSILYYIQSGYRIGYDEIHVRFSNPIVPHFRLKQKEKVSSVLHYIANRLIGYEIVQQQENYCVIKDISEISINEFDTVLRRIFLLMKDMSKDMVEGAKKLDLVMLETIEEKHDSITKFISYCLRLLNKFGFPDTKKTCIYYHIIANLDKVVDVFKYGARDMIALKLRLSKDSKEIMDSLLQAILLYSDLFFKFETAKITELYETRDEVINKIKQITPKMDPKELRLIVYMRSMLELIIDVTEARMGLEY